MFYMLFALNASFDPENYGKICDGRMKENKILFCIDRINL